MPGTQVVPGVVPVALVTGGASGIGKAIASRLAADGVRVVISDVQPELGEATALELEVNFLHQDVTNEAHWNKAVEEVEKRFQGLHILVNNAGILGPIDPVSPEDTRLEDWKRVFAVNVEGVFLGCRAAIPAMRRAGSGSIINISSVAGLLATPYATAYGASKAAVRQLTKSVAQHCAEQGLKIRCNSVHPGDVATPLLLKRAQETAKARGVDVEQVFEETRAIYPLGELVREEDIAAAVAFLASDESAQITGTQLIVDGGLTQCNSYHMNRAHRLRASESFRATEK